MENTKANVVKLLKALHKQSLGLADIWEREGNEMWQRTYMREAFAYDVAIDILTNQKTFDTICEIMKVGTD